MDFEKLYIDGAWVPSASDKWIEVEKPASRSVIARVPAGNAEDVDRAAKAASEMGLASIWMVSRTPVTAGEVNRPVFKPFAVAIAWIIRAVEPLPLVPAT